MSPLVLAVFAVGVPDTALVWADGSSALALGLAGILAAAAAGLFTVRDRRTAVRRVVPRLRRAGHGGRVASAA